eukprot:5423385-Amphidinium_carterae.1
MFAGFAVAKCILRWHWHIIHVDSRRTFHFHLDYMLVDSLMLTPELCALTSQALPLRIGRVPYSTRLQL